MDDDERASESRPFAEAGQSRLGRHDAPTGRSRLGPLGKLFAAMSWALLLVAAFAFSLVLFAVLVAVGLLVWAYLWWKTRALRKQMRERPPGGRVIEGEVIRD